MFPRFAHTLAELGVSSMVRETVATLQVNVGKLCNQACHHCHVDAGPTRTEVMDEAVADRVLTVLAASPLTRTLDLTGGAPELNPNFRRLVTGAGALGRQVIDRCNLTVLFEPGMDDLAEFLAEHRVGVTASLPCYGPANVEKQRGVGTFAKSIEALKRLNALGYGTTPGLPLDLVYNPLGAELPPSQAELEARYREELRSAYGIEFDHLLTITNMPIKRFADMLARTGAHEAYMGLLVSHFNPATVDGLMCRSLVSVGWDGQLYDCDFNQMLSLPLQDAPATIWDVETLDDLAGVPITTADHCYGCTAGAGSSCGGTLQ